MTNIWLGNYYYNHHCNDFSDLYVKNGEECVDDSLDRSGQVPHLHLVHSASPSKAFLSCLVHIIINFTSNVREQLGTASMATAPQPANNARWASSQDWFWWEKNSLSRFLSFYMSWSFFYTRTCGAMGLSLEKMSASSITTSKAPLRFVINCLKILLLQIHTKFKYWIQGNCGENKYKYGGDSEFRKCSRG